VHRVADPRDLRAARGDLLHERGQVVAYAPGAHPDDEREAARLALRVERVDQGQGVLGGRRRAELDPDRVADVPHELHVRAVELPGALADPQEVRRDVVRQARTRVDAGQGALVVEQQRLVAGVDVDPVELLRVGARGVHERQRPVDLAREALVAAPGRAVRDEVLVPGVDLAQVGVAALGEGAAEVQRHGGGVVGAQEASRIRGALLGGEAEAVDHVAAVRRELDAVAYLDRLGTRLGELARHPADLHDRHARGVRQHDRHLQQRLELVAYVIGGGAGERLRAVAALENERLAARDRRELTAEQVALAREHQRRELGELAGHRVYLGGVGPFGLLGRWT
jgi:hypothetical protein